MLLAPMKTSVSFFSPICARSLTWPYLTLPWMYLCIALCVPACIPQCAEMCASWRSTIVALCTVLWSPQHKNCPCCASCERCCCCYSYTVFFIGLVVWNISRCLHRGSPVCIVLPVWSSEGNREKTSGFLKCIYKIFFFFTIIRLGLAVDADISLLSKQKRVFSCSIGPLGVSLKPRPLCALCFVQSGKWGTILMHGLLPCVMSSSVVAG